MAKDNATNRPQIVPLKGMKLCDPIPAMHKWENERDMSCFSVVDSTILFRSILPMYTDCMQLLT